MLILPVMLILPPVQISEPTLKKGLPEFSTGGLFMFSYFRMILKTNFRLIASYNPDSAKLPHQGSGQSAFEGLAIVYDVPGHSALH
jgi:hypothetical protein